MSKGVQFAAGADERETFQQPMYRDVWSRDFPRNPSMIVQAQRQLSNLKEQCRR
jgi:hypothetical protein